MSSPEAFTPPIKEAQIVGVHEGITGEIGRATLLITDSVEQTFTLTIATADNYEEMVTEDPERRDQADREPLFVVPVDDLTPDIIEEVVHPSHAMLARYLVQQDPTSS